MHLHLITLFPEMFKALNSGITGRALTNKLLTIDYWNPRDCAVDERRTVDDRPYGGGPGMIMMVQPLRDTIRRIKAETGQQAQVAYLSPQGRVFTQADAEQLAQRPHTIFLCGRYEGVDERLLQKEVDEEWSIGDYVLSGGELAAMVIIDAITRLLPGALGHEDSAKQDSFVTGLLDCPHYTRPEIIDGEVVPEVLRGGNHQQIADWRLQQSLGRTWLRRPDLLQHRMLSAKEQVLLEAFIFEYQRKKP